MIMCTVDHAYIYIYIFGLNIYLVMYTCLKVCYFDLGNSCFILFHFCITFLCICVFDTWREKRIPIFITNRYDMHNMHFYCTSIEVTVV